MKGKSSSSSSNCRNGGELIIENIEKSKEPHLSGASIRSHVKQLTSSKTSNNVTLEGSSNNQDLSENRKQGKSPSPPQKEHKKQVRRRLHTNRPYQERLLNMAEARREIVTALKFHRASMKQASENQQQQQMDLESSSLEQETKLKSWRNPRIYASNSTPNNLSYPPYSWQVSPIGPPPMPPPFFQENLNFQLPSQTLGLNLNLQDFTNLDTSNFLYNNNPPSIYSSSSTEETPCTVMPPPEMVVDAVEFGDDGLHHAMDDKEMEEIRSIGEQHQLEWDDTMNMMTSACWVKFLKAMDIGNVDQEDGDFANSSFDEVMEFPTWLSGNDQSFVEYHCSDDYLQDYALPCMNIEEIEGMDVDWLA